MWKIRIITIVATRGIITEVKHEFSQVSGHSGSSNNNKIAVNNDIKGCKESLHKNNKWIETNMIYVLNTSSTTHKNKHQTVGVKTIISILKHGTKQGMFSASNNTY